MEKKVRKKNSRSTSKKKIVKKRWINFKKKKKTNSKKKKRTNSKKKKKGFFTSRRFWVLVVIAISLLLLLFFTNFYLYYQYMIGNDVIVRLNLENRDLYIDSGDSEVLSFENSIVANPFCSVECSYNFRDMSDGVNVDSGKFRMKSVEPFNAQYTVSAPLYGSGQKLFRYDVSCVGISSFLCYTDGRKSTKSAVITLNYDTNEVMREIKLNLERDYNLVDSKLNLIINNLNKYDFVISNLSHIDFVLEKEILVSTRSDIIGVNRSMGEFESLWSSQDLHTLSTDMETIKSKLGVIENNYDNLSLSIDEIIYDYNDAVSSFVLMIDFVEENVRKNMSENVSLNFNLFSQKLNNYFEAFYSFDSVRNKVDEIEILNDEYLILKAKVDSDVGGDLITDLIFIFSRPEKIYLELLTEFNGDFLTKLFPRCCLDGVCSDCCDDSCFSDESKYPILFLHGHDFSSSVSAEHNLNIFSEIQRIFETEYSVYDFGSSLLNIPEEADPGVWGKLNSSISVRSSYYFESVHSGEEGEFDILQAKMNDIDSYAIRLNDIIRTLKIKTNREKIVLVSQSMGGLVVRRYLQVFGSDSVEKVVMINSPNHGVSGNVNRFCSFFGSKDECEDMSEDSLFIGRINVWENQGLEINNVIGIGCDMDGETGDGIVKNSSAYLLWANNYYFEGQCDEFSFEYLHNDILNVDKYPRTSGLIAELLSL